MTFAKSCLVGLGTALAWASSASAQGMAIGQAYAVDRSGTVNTVQMNEKGHAMMMRYAHRLPAGTIVYISGGHIYTISKGGMAGRIAPMGSCCN
jgi:hypothetical protein